MASTYLNEIAAVNRIRSRNPGVAQRTLARRIKYLRFPPLSPDHPDAYTASEAPYATTYNRIRRYDLRELRFQSHSGQSPAAV